jgi:hypothetical protein
MRLENKYRIYGKARYVYRYPTRILKFKTTKWTFARNFIRRKLFRRRRRRKLRRRLSKKRRKRLRYYKFRRKFRKFKRRRFSFATNLVVKIKKHYVIKRKNAYKDKLNRKRLLLIMLSDNKHYLKNLQLKSKKEYLTLAQEYFRYVYSIDYALLFNSFYSSVYASKESLRQKKIFVNYKLCKKLRYLKQGDLVTVQNNSFRFKRMKLKYSKAKRLNTVHQIDYYTQSFFVLKDSRKLTDSDLATSAGQQLHFNMKNIKKM